MLADQIKVLWSLMDLDWGVLVVALLTIGLVYLTKKTGLAESGDFRRFAAVAIAGGLAYFRVVLGEASPDLDLLVDPRALSDLAEVESLINTDVSMSAVQYAQWFVSWLLAAVTSTGLFRVGKKLSNSEG